VDVTVVVATFGDETWERLADERAVPSAEPQAPVIRAHAENLSAARNLGLSQVETEWVVHLDADDELEPGYVDAMETGTADVRGPMAHYIGPGRDHIWQPRVSGHQHDCAAECLEQGNWLLIGSAVRTDLIREAGGWREYPWSEDWSTWIRCWKAGGSFELIRDAIYRAHVRPDSRNRGATRQAKDDAHWEIHRAEFPEQYQEAA
jgi:glycosyltransferase involved in cell wall biosynthesis